MLSSSKKLGPGPNFMKLVLKAQKLAKLQYLFIILRYFVLNFLKALQEKRVCSEVVGLRRDKVSYKEVYGESLVDDVHRVEQVAPCNERSIIRKPSTTDPQTRDIGFIVTAGEISCHM